MINWQKSFYSLGILAIPYGIASLHATSPVSASVLSWPPLLAQSNSIEVSLKFPPTGNRGAPKATTGGGSRGEDTTCISAKENEPSLIALMPNRENAGKTAAATPTLYWYIPESTATSGEFVLLDEDDNEAYQTTFALPGQPGIVKLSIPTTASLKTGKRYSWSFSLICDSQYRNRDQYVEGVIEYTELNWDLKEQLKNATPLEKARLYAESAVWHETFDTVAQLRSENPTEWEELLTSVGLEVIAQAPFRDCCIADQ